MPESIFATQNVVVATRVFYTRIERNRDIREVMQICISAHINGTCWHYKNIAYTTTVSSSVVKYVGHHDAQMTNRVVRKDAYEVVCHERFK